MLRLLGWIVAPLGWLLDLPWRVKLALIGVVVLIVFGALGSSLGQVVTVVRRAWQAVRSVWQRVPQTLRVIIGALALLVVLQVRHAGQVRDLREHLATMDTARMTAQAATATLRVQVSDLAANRDALIHRIAQQNQAIAGLQVRARAAEARASLAAVRRLADGAAESARLRRGEPLGPAARPVRPGHKAMNLWLSEAFAR